MTLIQCEVSYIKREGGRLCGTECCERGTTALRSPQYWCIFYKLTERKRNSVRVGELRWPDDQMLEQIMVKLKVPA